MTFFSKNPTFDKLIEKATSHLLLEPDWSTNLTVCDMVRQGEVSGKYAVGLIKKKLNHSNPHVVIYTLNLIESMAKNCGSAIHDEIATSDFMNQMKSLTKEKDPVKSKTLELIQVWSHAFRHQPKYSVVQTTYSFLKSQGSIFPTLIESDAMFASETAPEWQDADYCYRCKIGFSTLKRKHHCRNCGNIFCDECTSKRSNIPKFGIEKDVRVCESCYDQLKGGGGGTSENVRARRIASRKGSHVQFNEDVVVRNFVPESKDQTAPSETAVSRAQKERDLEMQEKEELELALALSASEAESQEMKRNKTGNMGRLASQSASLMNNSVGVSATNKVTGNAPFNSGIYSSLDTTEMDPELARYLNRNYWEAKANNDVNAKTTQPSAPVMHHNSPTIMATNVGLPSQQPSSNEKPINSSMANLSMVSSKVDDLMMKQRSEQFPLLSSEQEEFLSALKSSIEIFINRMHSNHQRGRNIANDSAVQTLFLTLNAMHPQLLQLINKQEDRRNYFEALQDKLAQLRDAREALDALREEHREKKRQQEEEAAKLRQIQMMQKLEVMRQKKQEFLDYQRQLAVDRLQQQEQEMAMRLAQQKQIMQIRQYQQQFPYSLQQHQQGMPPVPVPMDSLMVAAAAAANQQHQLPQHHMTQSAGIGVPTQQFQQPLAGTGGTEGGCVVGAPNMMVVDSYGGAFGTAVPNQFVMAPHNKNAATEYYNNLKQSISDNPNVLGGIPQPNPNSVAYVSQKTWELPNPNSHTPNASQPGDGNKDKSQDQKENQLISFD